MKDGEAMKMTNAEKLELAYLAGAMDADGFFTMTKTRTKSKNTTTVTICESVGLGQLQPTVPRMLQARFGGYIQVRSRPEGRNWRSLYYWCASTKCAALCAETLRPFLRVKAKQADLILALRASKDLPLAKRRNVKAGRSFSTNPGVVAYRERLWQRIKTLNHNGVTPKN
jgi:hypothetical protein